MKSDVYGGGYLEGSTKSQITYESVHLIFIQGIR